MIDRLRIFILRWWGSATLRFALGYALLLFVSIFLTLQIPNWVQKSTLRSNEGDKSVDSMTVALRRASLEKELAKTKQELNAKVPKGYYLVINTASNEFSLHKGTQLVKRDKCSTGSYVLLKKGDQQEWMFKTPKGEFKIRNKTTSPVWKKPDWAFVEEGLPVPSPNHRTRFEYGVLGDYSLSLGQGYLIHGTLYQRFLGLPVTHGCVRLNDENLELVYKSLPIGAKVFIF